MCDCENKMLPQSYPIIHIESTPNWNGTFASRAIFRCTTDNLSKWVYPLWAKPPSPSLITA